MQSFAITDSTPRATYDAPWTKTVACDLLLVGWVLHLETLGYRNTHTIAKQLRVPLLICKSPSQFGHVGHVSHVLQGISCVFWVWLFGFWLFFVARWPCGSSCGTGPNRAIGSPLPTYPRVMAEQFSTTEHARVHF